MKKRGEKVANRNYIKGGQILGKIKKNTKRRSMDFRGEKRNREIKRVRAHFKRIGENKKKKEVEYI